jgi:hypothetical protein
MGLLVLKSESARSSILIVRVVYRGRLRSLLASPSHQSQSRLYWGCPGGHQATAFLEEIAMRVCSSEVLPFHWHTPEFTIIHSVYFPYERLRTISLKIKPLKSLALPREARELSRLNSLHEGLGLEPVIGFQGVSTAAPKPIGPLL